MLCSRCGLLNTSGVKYCVQCGMPLEVQYKFQKISGEGSSLAVPKAADHTSITSRYQSMREIKRTSIGTIMLVKDKVTQKKFILKRYHPPSNKERELELLLQKSAEIQTLNHLNIASIYQIGQDEEGPFIITEYIEGSSLASTLKEKGPFSVDETVRVVRSISSALAFAHKKGIYHGTLNPYSVLVNDRSEPKLVDFCLTLEDSDKTIDYYLAPEQKEKNALRDYRVDIYALGALTYKMVTGEAPREIELDKVPEELKKIISLATEYQRVERFSNMERFFDALNNFEDDSEETTDSSDEGETGDDGDSVNQELTAEQEVDIAKRLAIIDSFVEEKLYKSALNKLEEFYGKYSQADDIQETMKKFLHSLHQEDFPMTLNLLLDAVDNRNYSQVLLEIKNLLFQQEMAEKEQDSGEKEQEKKRRTKRKSKSRPSDFEEDELDEDDLEEDDFDEGEEEDLWEDDLFESSDSDPWEEEDSSYKNTKMYRKVLDRAKKLMAKHEYKEVAKLCRKILSKDKTNSVAKNLLKKATAKGKKFKQLCQEARDLEDFGDLQEALTLWKKALMISPKHKGVKNKILRLKEKLAEDEEIDSLLHGEDDPFADDPFADDDLDEEVDSIFAFDTEKSTSPPAPSGGAMGWMDDLDEEDDELTIALRRADQALRNCEFGEAYKLAKSVMDIDIDNEKARTLAKTAREKGMELKQYIEDARIKESEGEMVEAYKLWKRAHKFAPTNEIVAKRYLDLKKEYAPHSEGPSREELLLQKAKRYYEDYLFAEALEECEKVLSLSPGNPKALELKAESERAIKQSESALLGETDFSDLTIRDFGGKPKKEEEEWDRYKEEEDFRSSSRRSDRESSKPSARPGSISNLNINDLENVDDESFMDRISGLTSETGRGSGTGKFNTPTQSSGENKQSTPHPDSQTGIVPKDVMDRLNALSDEDLKGPGHISNRETEVVPSMGGDVNDPLASLFGSSQPSSSGQEDPAIDIGNEFSALRRQREEELKETTSSKMGGFSDINPDLPRGFNEGVRDKVNRNIQDIDEESETEKIALPDDNYSNSSSDNSPEEEPFDPLANLMASAKPPTSRVSPNDTNRLTAQPRPSRDTGRIKSDNDEVSSLLEEIEATSGSSDEHAKSSGPTTDDSLSKLAESIEDNGLRDSINKAIHETDQADFADTEKIQVSDIAGGGGDDESIPMSYLGATSEIHRPSALSNDSDQLVTSEIDAALFSQATQGDETKIDPGTQKQKTPTPIHVGETEEVDTRDMGREEEATADSSEEGGGLSDLFAHIEGSSSAKEKTPVPSAATPEPEASESKQETNPWTDAASSPLEQFEGMTTESIFKSDLENKMTDPQSSDQTSPQKNEEPESSENTDNIFDAIESAFEDESSGTGGDEIEELFGQTQGAATSEINAFMDDYDVTSELDAMNLKEANIKQTRKQEPVDPSASPMDYSTDPTDTVPVNTPGDTVKEGGELPSFDWSPDDDNGPARPPSSMWEGSGSRYLPNLLEDLFPEAQGQKGKGAGESKGSGFFIKFTIGVLLLVILIPTGVIGWLYFNYNNALSDIRHKKYQAGLDKLDSISYPYFVALLDKREYNRAYGNACLGLAKTKLEGDNLDLTLAQTFTKRAQKYVPGSNKLKNCQRLIELFTHLDKGEKFRNEENYLGAISEFNKAKKLAVTQPEHSRAEGKIKSARESWLEEITTRKGKGARHWNNQVTDLGQMHDKFPRDDKVQDHLKKARYEFNIAKFNECISTTASDRMEEAKDYLKEAIKYNQSAKTKLIRQFRVLLYKQALELRKANLYDAALKKLEFLQENRTYLKVQRSDVKARINQVLYEKYLALASQFMKKEKWIGAIENFKKAVKYGDSTVLIIRNQERAKDQLLNQAQIYERSKKWAEAAKIYKKLSTHFPSNYIAERLNNANYQDKRLQADYFKNELYWGKARKFYMAALKFRPKDRHAQRQLEFLTSRNRLYNRFQKVIKLAKDLESKKKWKKAEQAYLRAGNIMGIYKAKCTWLPEKIQTCAKRWRGLRDSAYKRYFNRGLKELTGKNPYRAAASFKAALEYKSNDREANKYYRFARSLKGMIYVPQSNFTMGAEGKGVEKDQGPKHQVFVKAFYMDKTEVTNKEYRKFLNEIRRNRRLAGQLAHPQQPPGKDYTPKFWNDSRYNKDNMPVVGVDFFDAYAYAKWAGKRLPTEQEWEKAARGDKDDRKWPWGNNWDPNNLNHYSTGPKRPMPVGSYPRGASPYGCMDMAGNVWEWVDSPYKAYPKSDFSPPADTVGAYVARGGSWNDYEVYLGAKHLTEVTFRMPFKRLIRGPHIGFRCVKEPNP